MIVSTTNRVRPIVEAGVGDHPIGIRVAGFRWSLTTGEAVRLADALVDGVEAHRFGLVDEGGVE